MFRPDSNLQEMITCFKEMARFDHSVSVPELGSLFQFDPDRALGQMQQRVAQIYQTPFAFLTTNGTTSLNVLALMTVTHPGDAVLVQRDSHVSVFAPMIHAGLRPVYVEPEYDPQLALNLGVTPQKLRQALRENPEVRAVFLTYPNYFGIAGDLYGCAQVVNQFNLPLIVDAAHGAHFGFHPDLPLPAQHTTAAIITQSTHKTCSALSQGSLALFNQPALTARFYELVNQLGFVSTSFSYVILASVALGVIQLQQQGQSLLTRAIEGANRARTALNRTEALFSFGPERRQPGFAAFDPLRVTVDVSRTGYTGFEIEQQLIDRFRIYPEMATLQHVLFLFTLADDRAAGRQVVTALRALIKQSNGKEPGIMPDPPALPSQKLPPRPVFFRPDKRCVSLRDSVGAISAETIACYPPGSAIIVAGEVITPEIIAFLQEIHYRGGVLKGASDPEFKTITIID